MDSLRNLKYVELPMVVLLDEDISSTSKVLMGLITTLTMKDGHCYASNKRLGNIMKVSKRTITSCITSLKRKNYIRVEQEPNERKIYLADIF